MRTIHKNGEPQSLTEYRQQNEACYDNYPDKDTLRQYLVAEQRGLCCYCMSRIRPDRTRMKIEHWQCQAGYPLRQLDYKNLLGSCLGEEGRSWKYQHCDTRKGNQELRFCPAIPAHRIEERLQYLGDGRIKSTDDLFNQQLNDVLNLNLPSLVSNRKAVLDIFQKSLQPGKKLDPAKELPKWDGSVGGELHPFCQVVVYYLKKKLGIMSR